jgi:hypothetical protein
VRQLVNFPRQDNESALVPRRFRQESEHRRWQSRRTGHQCVESSREESVPPTFEGRLVQAPAGCQQQQIARVVNPGTEKRRKKQELMVRAELLERIEGLKKGAFQRRMARERPRRFRSSSGIQLLKVSGLSVHFTLVNHRSHNYASDSSRYTCIKDLPSSLSCVVLARLSLYMKRPARGFPRDSTRGKLIRYDYIRGHLRKKLDEGDRFREADDCQLLFCQMKLLGYVIVGGHLCV